VCVCSVRNVHVLAVDEFTVYTYDQSVRCACCLSDVVFQRWAVV